MPRLICRPCLRVCFTHARGYFRLSRAAAADADIRYAMFADAMRAFDMFHTAGLPSFLFLPRLYTTNMVNAAGSQARKIQGTPVPPAITPSAQMPSSFRAPAGRLVIRRCHSASSFSSAVQR